MASTHIIISGVLQPAPKGVDLPFEPVVLAPHLPEFVHHKGLLNCHVCLYPLQLLNLVQVLCPGCTGSLQPPWKGLTGETALHSLCWVLLLLPILLLIILLWRHLSWRGEELVCVNYGLFIIIIIIINNYPHAPRYCLSLHH